MIAPNSTVKLLSLPARGAWIEIGYQGVIYIRIPSLPARGAWIEIVIRFRQRYATNRRSPHGERGLKFLAFVPGSPVFPVAPRTGSVD